MGAEEHFDHDRLSTLAGIRHYVLGQLEDALPGTRLRWGAQVRLLPGPAGAGA